MAKSKSRRARRQQSEKQSQPTATVAQPAAPTENESTAPAADLSRSLGRKIVDYGQEYFYVYRELRTILLVAVLMFAVMIGLAYFM